MAVAKKDRGVVAHERKDYLSGLRIFIFGNRGYSSLIIDNFLSRGETVAGVCSKIPGDFLGGDTLKLFSRIFGLPKREDFMFCDPFARFPFPHTLAARYKIPFFSSRLLNSAIFEEKLRELKIDLILVAGFHRRIPPGIISIPRIAAVNLHPSLLPRHRGGTPNRWVIRNGETRTGVTAHLLEEKVDSGAILMQKAVEVGRAESWGELELRIADLMVVVAGEVAQKIQTGTYDLFAQDETEATYEPAFKGAFQVIDWALPAEEILRICLAVKPKSSGITSYKGNRLCVWNAEPVERENFLVQPGAILGIDRYGNPIVACGKDAVRISHFLRAGRIVDAAALVRKLKIRPGDFFGTDANASVTKASR